MIRPLSLPSFLVGISYILQLPTGYVEQVRGSVSRTVVAVSLGGVPLFTIATVSEYLSRNPSGRN